MSDRPLPHSIESERAVLGCFLVKPSAIDDVPELRVDDFFLPMHRCIFESAKAVVGRGAALDIIALSDELRARGEMRMLEGQEAYLLACANTVPTAENVRHYARAVAGKAALRRLIAACADVQSSAYGDFGDIQEFLADARRKISAVDLADADDEPQRIGTDLEDLMKSIQERGLDPASYFITTGIKSFDEQIGGLRGGQLIIIAARPGKGKSAAALDICVDNAIRAVPSLKFSMEMTRPEVQERVLSKKALVNGRNIVRGRMEQSEWNRLASAVAKVHDIPFFLYTKNVTAERICSMSRRWFGRLPDPPDGRRKKAVIAIDYLGLVRSSGNDETRALEIAAMTRAFKALAVELDVPVILLSQLNREIEKSAKVRKPVPSDLRDSGAIEQDANMIIFPWWEGESPSRGRKEAQLIVGKNRGGPLGEVDVDWYPEFTSFADRESSAYTLFDGTGETGRIPYAD